MRVAAQQSLRQQLAQITFAREMFRRMKNRIMQLAEFNLQIAFVGDFQRVLHRFRRFGEARAHFLRRPQVKLLRLIAHPLGVGEHRLRADANQAIVRVRIAFVDVVNVVRRDQLQAELLRPGDQMAVHLRLLGDAVVLQFEEKIVRAERLLEPVHGIARLVQLVLHDPVGILAGQTAGHRDQPFLCAARISLSMRGL
jgi:hypothetical protein